MFAQQRCFSLKQRCMRGVVYMISMKEYATLHNISYEAVRKQVKRYETELKGHISKVGRTNYLDDEAVEFLNEKRSKNPVVIVDEEKKDQIQRLSDENKQLLIKIVQLQDELSEEKDLVKDLQAQLIAEKDHVAELQGKLTEALVQTEDSAQKNVSDETTEDKSDDPFQSIPSDDRTADDNVEDNSISNDNIYTKEGQEEISLWQKIKAFFIS